MTGTHRRYVRRRDRPGATVRLALDTDGLVYRQWGGEQRAKAGDWLVDNGRNVYTVDAAEFERTDERTGTGSYVKTTPVWAEVATHSGTVKTKEGSTDYNAGDYLVSNNRDGSDGWAVEVEEFEDLYFAEDDEG